MPLAAALTTFYSDDPLSSPDLAGIVNDAHTARLVGLLEGHGGASSEEDRSTTNAGWLRPRSSPTPDPRSPLMQEEILGPVLPVLAVDDLEEAIVFVNDRPRPLALYVFSENEDTVRRIVGRTSSGGVCVNHTPDRVAGAALRWRR